MTRLDFNPFEEGRYARQQMIGWWDQERLKGARVIVAGAGALGNEVLKLLALMGVGRITVVDFDRVSPSNLARMVLFHPEDVGRTKVEVAVERLAEINPQVEVQGVPGDLRFDLGLGAYREADLVFGCLDSVNARWALNRRSYQAGATLIDGGISDFHGQVSHYRPGAGACYECTFSPATYERFNRRYSCPYGLLGSEADRKTPTTAVTTSITAALQVQEALYALHGLEGAGLAPGERLSIYLKPYRLIRDRLPENPDCLAHESLPEKIEVIRLPGLDHPVEALLQSAGRFFPGADCLELGFDLVVAFNCPDCGVRRDILRPKEKVRQSEARCPQCGQLGIPEIAGAIKTGSPLASISLARLGLPWKEILALSNGEQKRYLQIEPALTSASTGLNPSLAHGTEG